MAGSLWMFSLAQGLLLGLLGTSATFAPLVADTSLWFTRRRGIALGICMSGNYVAGAIWPPVIQHFVDTVGWRPTYIGIGVFCVLTVLPLALVYRRRPPALMPVPVPGPASSPSAAVPAIAVAAPPSDRPLGMSPLSLQLLLCVAGVACCVAMSMPQVHIVAYCGDLGFGAARGAQMLSVMFGMGIISRLVSGWMSDHIGGLYTLLVGSLLQGLALLMFLWADGVSSLFLVSAMFGLFQGGIVPSYALIVREYFTPKEAGARVGAVLDGHALRHGAGRLDVGRDLRCQRFVPRGLRQRHRLESAQCGHRAVSADARQAAGAVCQAAAAGVSVGAGRAASACFRQSSWVAMGAGSGLRPAITSWM